ncbi:Nitrogen permease regulator 3 [Dimargaris cristalligena]|nr:Nitrogen permease regulator 3 [Dimargaris cristalligena]
MSELLSIFLISESSGERQVLFRYPLDPLIKRHHPRNYFDQVGLRNYRPAPNGPPTTSLYPSPSALLDSNRSQSDQTCTFFSHPVDTINPRPIGYILSKGQVRPREGQSEQPEIPTGSYCFIDESRGLRFFSPSGLTGSDESPEFPSGDGINDGVGIAPLPYADSIMMMNGSTGRPSSLPTEEAREGGKFMSTDGWSKDAAIGLSNKAILTFLARNAARGSCRFQTIIDDLMFLGRPFTVKHRIQPVSESTRPRRTRPSLQHPSLTLRRRSLRGNASTTSLRSSPAPTPVASPPSHPSGSDETPQSLYFDYDSSDSDSAEPLSPHSANQYQKNLVHILFVIDNSYPEAEEKAELIYHHIVNKLCAVLDFAQKSGQYVSQEVQKLSLNLEKATRTHLTMAEWLNRALAQSSLARTLAEVYDTIFYDRVVHLLIDNKFSLSLQVPRLKENLWCALSQEELQERLALYPYIQPQQILLPLEEPDKILASLPPDVNLSLTLLVKELPHRRALGDLHSVIDCSLAQMYRMAAHMIYWRKAKVINKPKLGCEYVVSPNADLSRIHEYNAEFAPKFPKINLVEFLASFSTPKSFLKHIQNSDPEVRAMYFGALEFLLSRDLVTEIHTYVYAKTPGHLKPVFPWDEPTTSGLAVSNGGGWPSTPTQLLSLSGSGVPPPVSSSGIITSAPTTPHTSAPPAPPPSSTSVVTGRVARGTGTGGGYPEDPSPGIKLSRTARTHSLQQWIQEIDEKYPNRKLRFHDLFKYLDGKHNTYEIHYLLQMSFRDLKSTLKLYRNHLINIKHC